MDANAFYAKFLGFLIRIFRGPKPYQGFKEAVEESQASLQNQLNAAAKAGQLTFGRPISTARAKELVDLYKELGKSGSVSPDLVRGRATRFLNQRACSELFKRLLGISLDSNTSWALSRFPDATSAVRAALAYAGCEFEESASEPTLQTVYAIVGKEYHFCPEDRFHNFAHRVEVIEMHREIAAGWAKVSRHHQAIERNRMRSRNRIQRMAISLAAIEALVPETKGMPQ